MTVSSDYTFQLDTPRRPAESDILNGTKSNATPTVPPQMPAAEEFMQMGRQIVGLARMTPLVRLTVANSGTPSLTSFQSVRDDLLSGDFTVTDNGAGDTSITWASGTFPTAGCQPIATLNKGVVGNSSIDAQNITLGVRVKTSTAGVAADIPFTVQVG